MTKGKPLKLIFLFALPLMLGNILQQLYTMVDTMIVGQFLGVNALASLGAADWINWAILGIVMGFTQGFSIRISRTFGAEDYGNMKRSMHMIFFLCAFFSILTTVVAELSIVPLLTLLNTPSNVIQGSITYLRIMSGGLTITMFYNCFSSILRSLGDSRTPLLAMIGGAITNICLDLLFVVVFKWGIAGAAIATLLAQFLTTIFCLYMLKKELPFKLELTKFKFEKKIIKKLKPLQDVGLGYIKLGQTSSTLSGGENQRVKLAYYLGQEKQVPTLFIFDEPTTGLHFHDIKTLLEAFQALIRKGHTVVIIEHNMDVIKCADYIVDLGPEGGDAGGFLVCAGTPEEVAQCPGSYTGKYLREKLES